MITPFKITCPSIFSSFMSMRIGEHTVYANSDTSIGVYWLILLANQCISFALNYSVWPVYLLEGPELHRPSTALEGYIMFPMQGMSHQMDVCYMLKTTSDGFNNHFVLKLKNLLVFLCNPNICHITLISVRSWSILDWWQMNPILE